MGCLSHGLKAGSGLGNSQDSWLQVTETQVTASSKTRNYWLAKLKSPRLGMTIFKFSKICHHKSISVKDLFIPLFLSFYPCIIYVLSVCSSIYNLFSLLFMYHHHFCFSLFLLYSQAETYSAITMPRIVFTS